MRDGRLNRGQEAMARQMAQMEAAGLAGPEAAAQAQAQLGWVKAGRGKQWREWWRVAIGAVMLVGGVGLWFIGRLLTIPPTVRDRYGLPVADDPAQRAISEHTSLEVLGVFSAFVGLVWLGNQVWPRRRTYSPREVRRAWVIGALLVADGTLWFFANRNEGVLSGSFLFGVSVFALSTGFIIRMTGPDTARNPVNDPRGDVIRFLTPWPVMLGIALAYGVYQLVLLAR